MLYSNAILLFIAITIGLGGFSFCIYYLFTKYRDTSITCISEESKEDIVKFSKSPLSFKDPITKEIVKKNQKIEVTFSKKEKVYYLTTSYNFYLQCKPKNL